MKRILTTSIMAFLCLVVTAPASAMTVTMGKAKLVKLKEGVVDVLVADPNVIDVQAVQSDQLYIVGLEIGDTNLVALDAAGNVVRKMDIHVTYDLYAIRKLVRDLYPREKIKVSSIHDKIVLTGTASTPEVAARASDVVASYVSGIQGTQGAADQMISNMLSVRGEQQVMLQVKIIETTRSVMKELGAESSLGPGSSGSFSGAFQTGAGLALGGDPTGIASFLFDTGIDALGNVGFVLNALEEENLVNILAEPNLTAVSGQQAGFLAGGEFPVPVGRDQIGNIVIEFREFGVSLNFKPIVMSDKRISLQLNTEVSSLDFDNAIVLADLTVPGLDIRRADTTVEIPSGGSIMIAGLLQSQAIEGMSGLPGISKTPVLGDLVKSDSFQRDETELVVIVTGYLVGPHADENRAEHVPMKAQESAPSRTFKSKIQNAYSGLDRKKINAMGQAGYVLN